MTAIFYTDCEATSPSGRFILEARSPHNGTIPPRKRGQSVENDFAFKYREHQSQFRYRLLDTSSGSTEPRIVWERWQAQKEDSPHELVVSDDGWSIIRTHGFKPEVIAVSPSGHDTLRLRVVGKDGASDADAKDGESSPQEGRRYTWQARRLVWSTAGTYWAGHSWPYFFQHEGTTFFVWRTYWGQRLLLDLPHAILVPEDDPAWATLAPLMDEAEKRGAQALLTELSARMDEVQRLLADSSGPGEAKHDPLHDKLFRAVAAFHLVGVHRIQTCLLLLQRWEAIDAPLYSTGSTAFGGGASSGWLEAQYFRPIIHHSLRLLGVPPQGYAAYHFRTHGNDRLPMPERLTDRRQRAADLKQSMSAQQVLQCMGSPDCIRRRSQRVDSEYRSTEEWEYDLQDADAWVTLRITWEERKRKGRIASIEEVPAPWLQSDDRVLEILGH